jgi:Methyltransferase FkbM domain
MPEYQVNDAPAVVRLRKVQSQRRRDGLISHARDHTSQNGEDGIIERIFQLLPLRPYCHGIETTHNHDQMTIQHTSRICVDVGAWDGLHLSNTRSLLCNNGQKWCGILIEADPQKFNQLSSLYADTDHILVNTSISVINPLSNPNSLHRILEDKTTVKKLGDSPVDVDFLCIDVDGPDYHILHDLLHLSKCRPVVICIEFNPTMPNDLIYIPVRSDVQRQVRQLYCLPFIK